MASAYMTSEYSTTTTTGGGGGRRKISSADPLFCAGCHAAIEGKALKAGSKFWHDYHFKCSDCGLRYVRA